MRRSWSGLRFMNVTPIDGEARERNASRALQQLPKSGRRRAPSKRSSGIAGGLSLENSVRSIGPRVG